MKKGFTPEEQKFIQDNRLKLPIRKLAEALGCSRSKVQKYLKDHNLSVPKEIQDKFRRGKTTFEPWQTEYLKEHYLDIPVKRLAANIGKSSPSVNIRMRQLGLVIPKEIIEQRKADSQFAKGHTSSNKGKRQEEFMSPEAIERTKGTRFKKGSVPKNAKYNGYERINKDGYIEIRIRQGEFVQKHRWVWEQHHGPIPESKIIAFKDGNTLNCDISNLEMISMRENMLRNSLHRFPEEVRPATKLIWDINYKIQQYGKE